MVQREELVRLRGIQIRAIHDEELEIGEVARTLGIPPGTVKSRLHYATQRLARAWREAEEEGEN